MSDDNEILFENQKRLERAPPKMFSENDEIPSDKQESDGRSLREDVPSDGELLSDEEKANEQIQPEVRDDSELSSEE